MKRFIINSILTVCFIILAAGCEDFGDMNVDPKKPSQVNPDYIFSYGQLELAGYVATSDVNLNVGRLLAQYWSQTTYTSESRYKLEDRELADAIWENHYRDVLNNLREAENLIPEYESNQAVINNKQAMIKVLRVYAYQMLVDTFGDVPYQDALKGSENKSPAYDNGANVYDNLINEINTAINQFDPANSGFTEADFIYGGNVNGWIKFANALKIRLGMRLADVDEEKAQTLVEEAYDNAILANENNAKLKYAGGGHPNPVYEDIVVSGRKDYVISNTLVENMKALDDPRLAYFMTKNANGEYAGLTYGRESGVGGNLDPYSKIADIIKSETYPANLMDAAEVNFFLAEAAERGWNVGNDAATYYENAISASIKDWGTASGMASDTLETQIENYLSNPDVAYSSAENGNGMDAIAKQKWIALYNRGMEAWMEWKRFDYPQLYAPLGMDRSDIPVRFKYPVEERSTNNNNRKEAAQRIGGDEYTNNVFWDVN